MVRHFVKAALIAGVFSAGSANAISILDTATYGGNTYQLLSEASWTDSEAYAVQLGGHLVTVNDAAENAFLTNTWGSQMTLWIGLYRTAPNAPTFAWTSGQAVTYTNWAPGEPNNFGGEDYTHTYSDGRWNDLANVSSYAFPQHGVVELTSAVPEPETYALMLAGLGLVGAITRRRLVSRENAV